MRDVGVVEGGQHLRLPSETREAIRIVGDAGKQHLDRDLTIQFGVASAIDLAHTPRAEEGDNFVRAEARACELGHCPMLILTGNDEEPSERPHH